MLLTQPFAPEQLEPVAAATTVSVVTQEFLDERTVSVRAVVGEPTAAILPVGGRVTSLECISGETISSGSAPLTVEGGPVLALHLDAPPWRDLEVGSKGRDVTALRAELDRLGFELTKAADDAPLSQDVAAAFRELAQRAGLEVKQGAPLPLASVVWLSAPEITIDSCSVRLGEQIAPGAELARSARPVESAAVASWPSMLAAGDRVVVIDGTEIPVNSEGTLLDLEAFAATTSFRAAGADESVVAEGSITGTLRLVEPVDVAVVPPGAVTSLDGVTGCVATGSGEQRAVQVVGSQLGQTFVVFDEAPDEVALTGPESCR